MSEIQTIAILGGGNIGLSLARGLVKAGIYRPEQIIVTRRNLGALALLSKEGFQTTDNNSDAVKDRMPLLLLYCPSS
jgi:pyrroline-5-carboxylate reductase